MQVTTVSALLVKQLQAARLEENQKDADLRNIQTEHSKPPKNNVLCSSVTRPQQSV